MVTEEGFRLFKSYYPLGLQIMPSVLTDVSGNKITTYLAYAVLLG